MINLANTSIDCLQLKVSCATTHEDKTVLTVLLHHTKNILTYFLQSYVIYLNDRHKHSILQTFQWSNLKSNIFFVIVKNILISSYMKWKVSMDVRRSSWNHRCQWRTLCLSIFKKIKQQIYKILFKQTVFWHCVCLALVEQDHNSAAFALIFCHFITIGHLKWNWSF